VKLIDFSNFFSAAFLASTDGSANITDWYFEIYLGTTQYIISQSDWDRVRGPWVPLAGEFSTAENHESPGTWTLVPEPATGLVVMAGLVGLAYRQRRIGRAANRDHA
jgi:hypothetical protein